MRVSLRWRGPGLGGGPGLPMMEALTLSIGKASPYLTPSPARTRPPPPPGRHRPRGRRPAPGTGPGGVLCPVVAADRGCARCGCEGAPRGSVVLAPARVDGVRVLGFDDSPHAALLRGTPSVWRHARGGEKDVTVTIDLAAIREGTESAQAVDTVQARSREAFTEELPGAVAVMDLLLSRERDPPVVRLARDELDRCRRRLQQETDGHRERTGDPRQATRRVLHTGADLLTSKQRQHLTALPTAPAHARVETTRGTYQRTIDAC